jgi:hypothetical protein
LLKRKQVRIALSAIPLVSSQSNTLSTLVLK